MGQKITSELAATVYSLPWLVARDEGLFVDEGLEVELVRAQARHSRPEQSSLIEDHRQVDSISSHILFELGEVQLYRACEWGQIRRAYDSKYGGQVVSKRSAVVSQAIIVRPGSPYVRPQDLSKVPVGVHFHSGSHYLTLQMLEGFLPRHEIKVAHVPIGAERYKGLLAGTLDAITVAEPWISLGEKQGCKVICEAHYQGSELACPEIDRDTYEAINRAIKRAVRLINADPRRYLHYLIADIPPELGTLSPDELHLPRLLYGDPALYSAEEFWRAYQWMVSWGLIEPEASFEKLVDNRIAAVCA